MIYDFNIYNEQLSSKTYDVCICGAGAAGITLAKVLSEQGKKVALLEGGGKEFSQQSQDSYKGGNVGIPYYMELWRLRYLGGTTNHWAGRCRPFVEQDFDDKNFNGLPGWPIEYEEISHYLSGAKKILDLPESDTFRATTDTAQIESNSFMPDESFVSQPVRFGEKYFDLLSQSPNIDLFVNANVTDIRLSDDLKTVNRISLKTFDGKEDSILASKYVLCMGAIENSRILLNSNTQIKEGIGNKTDMVGRCFMEHFNIDLGEFIADPDTWSDDTLSMEFFTVPEYSYNNKLVMSNVTFYIVTKLNAYGRTAELKKIFNTLSCRLGISQKIQFIYKHKCLGEGGISTLCEQFPYKESRVTLSQDRDKLGIRRVVLNWKMSQENEGAIRQVAIEVAKEFAKNDLGRVKLASYIIDRSSKIPTAAHAHQMGTTRMAESYENGVVDINCRVFETSNLYIAGSSIFSTGGGGNPTMPIIQLALRLSEHL